MTDDSKTLPPFRDLGLSYEEAMHGVQSAIRHRMALDGVPDSIANERGLTSRKHMRVGVEMSKSDAAGFARLLIDKGIFTLDEYVEYLRLVAKYRRAIDLDKN